MARTTARRGSSGSNRFASIPSVSTPRSSFNRSRGHKTTFDGGYLIPVLCDEMLPGDTFKCRTLSFVRMLTPLTPIMDQMFLDTFFFFVPNRILWDNWKRFMGEEPNPGDSTDFLIPTIDFSSLANGEVLESTLADYMGLPIRVDLSTADNTISALHFRAYNRIYEEWFRPQDIIDSPPKNTDDGPDDIADYTLLRRAKRHDYFTASLPFAQKGPNVTLPLGTTAPILGDATVMGSGPAPTFDHTSGTGVNLEVVATTTNVDTSGAAAAGVNEALTWNDPQLFADLQTSGVEVDLSNATAATINAIREATTLQQFYERQARSGTRYVETTKAFFGVDTPDARAQRPEYLGGSSDVLNVQPVAVTNLTVATNPGELGAFVTGGGSGNSWSYSATEHGVVLGLVMVRANLTYQQGVGRMWSRQTRFDFAYPIFSGLGEQEILNKEIYAQGASADNDTFGYQERYAEYRYAESRLSGLFRSEAPTSLDVWHLAQDFDSLPALNEAFIEEDPPFLRAVVTQDEDIFKGDFWFDINHVRPLPVYSVPGLQRF